ncbi:MULTISPECIES: hypothetical protein [unclassified Streptomyces]|nr:MULTISPECIES: hypothetical protein [unclassified Streptomyces]
MAEESSTADRCVQCESRRSKRQVITDWAPVIAVVIKEVVQLFWS